MDNKLKRLVEPWHDADNHHSIIDLLEKMPEQERDFETVSLLARAYNNVEQYQMAYHLLKSVADDGQHDERWHFRIGYALFYMDRYAEALEHFKVADRMRPGEGDTLYFIRFCNIHLPLRKRADDFWQWLSANEEQLAGIAEKRDAGAVAEKVDFIACGTRLLGDDVLFNIGGDHEFSFSVSGAHELFHVYPYVISRMPDSLKNKWRVEPFIQSAGSSFSLRMGGKEVYMDDVWVAADYDKDGNCFTISFYNESLVALEAEQRMGMFMLMLDNMLGEGVVCLYINDVKLAQGMADGMVRLTELRRLMAETVEAGGRKFVESPADSYATYMRTPEQSNELRFDVTVGSTCFMPLVSEYYSGSTGIFDRLNGFGAHAAFIAIPAGTDGGDDSANEALSFRHDLEDMIENDVLAPEGLGRVIGGAMGRDYCYIDLIVFDVEACFDKLKALLSRYPGRKFYLSDFRKNGEIYSLSEPEDGSGNDGHDAGQADAASSPADGASTGRQAATAPDKGYTGEEAEAVRKHIERFLGKYDSVFLGARTDRLTVDICIIPPTDDNSCYTLVTMGMGAHVMNVPDNLADEHLERAELAISLPADWKLDAESLADNAWYWPVRMLKDTVRFLLTNNAWIGRGHTLSFDDGPFAANTKLAAALVIRLQGVGEGGGSCRLPSGSLVNFYQLIPVYPEELDYKAKHGAGKLLEELAGLSYLVNPNRVNVFNLFGLTDTAPVTEDAWEAVANPQDGIRAEVVEHITRYFGDPVECFSEVSEPDIPLHVVVVKPRKKHDYYTLLTLGMSDYALGNTHGSDGEPCRQELLINLPPDWDMNRGDWSDESRYWPVRLLLACARLAIRQRTPYEWGEVNDQTRSFCEGTKLCAAICLSPGVFGEESFTRELNAGGEVEFMQVIPLYAEESALAAKEGVDRMLDCFPDELLEVINPLRANAVADAETVGYDPSEIDNADKHMRIAADNSLDIEPLAAFNHIAIYLRWCIERGLMSRPFLFKHNDVADAVRQGHSPDLRMLLRDDPDFGGRLTSLSLDHKGTRFTEWYNFENRSTPYEYIDDIKAYADGLIEAEGNGGAAASEFSYLLLPWSERYYQDMAKVIDRRFEEWTAHRGGDGDSLHEGLVPTIEIKPLLNDWAEADMCMASDRIVVEGMKVGYCYRERPLLSDRGWNSGWVFFANDNEDDDEGKLRYYPLNTVCNYDPDIIGLLGSQYGKVFYRDETGRFVEDAGDDADGGDQGGANPLETDAEQMAGDTVAESILFEGKAMLSVPGWSREDFLRGLNDKGHIVEPCTGDGDATHMFTVDDIRVAVSVSHCPIPQDEAVGMARRNDEWPLAVEMAKSHVAHAVISVYGNEESLLECGRLYAGLMDVCCHLPNVSAICPNGVAYEPQQYSALAGAVDGDELPVQCWIWVGTYKGEAGTCTYTLGMGAFGKDEMEVLDSHLSSSEVRDFLVNMASYVIECDVELHDGETIGRTKNEQMTVSRSTGVALPDRMTIKFGYEKSDDGMSDAVDSEDILMDDAARHLETLHEKNLPVEEITAYNHLAIYLRWCVENDLMSEAFTREYGAMINSVKQELAFADLRPFVRDELGGCLTVSLFNEEGMAFARYYYGDVFAPHFPSDIDDYALAYFGLARYHSNEFKDEAYLFIPFYDDYYQDMASTIERHFEHWQNQDYDEHTVEPSPLAKALMAYLDCPCLYFPSFKDDDPIASAYGYERRLGVREGYIPVLVAVDEKLLDALISNSGAEKAGADRYEFDIESIRRYREKVLSMTPGDGKALFSGLAAESGPLEPEAGNMVDGDENGLGFAIDGQGRPPYWNDDTQMTYPVILAMIPVRNPWEIFAYIPFGGFGGCASEASVMAVAKYWYDCHGAVASVVSHDKLEFDVPVPVSDDDALVLAGEQLGFCSSLLQDGWTEVTLADALRKLRKWRFRWHE